MFPVYFCLYLYTVEPFPLILVCKFRQNLILFSSAINKGSLQKKGGGLKSAILSHFRYTYFLGENGGVPPHLQFWKNLQVFSTFKGEKVIFSCEYN